jgi:hypothetical protein
MISLTAEGHTVKLRNLWLTLFISSLYLSQIKKNSRSAHAGLAKLFPGDRSGVWCGSAQWRSAGFGGQRDSPVPTSGVAQQLGLCDRPAAPFSSSASIGAPVSLSLLASLTSSRSTRRHEDGFHTQNIAQIRACSTTVLPHLFPPRSTGRGRPLAR